MNSLRAIAAASVSFFLMLLVGCGGGGGGGGGAAPAAATQTIRGTAASGAPIIGTVTIRDSNPATADKTVTIAADGKYTIDVTGLTPPFMLRADGTVGGSSYSLYSAAVTADINQNINITPLTDLIVANVAGQIASQYFTTGNFSTLTAAEIAAQQTALQARLLPILQAVGVSSSIDLLRTSFATDHTGLDAALDVLRVDIVGATATITNIINSTQITDNIASTSDPIVPIDATNTTTGLTDFQQIVASFNAFSALFATSLPASNNATLLDLIDPNFLEDGEDRQTFISNVTSDPTIVGLTLTNISLVPGSLLPVGAPTTAKVTFAVIQGGRVQEQALEFTVNKLGGVWKFAGNGHIARAEAASFTRMQDVYINNIPQTNYIDTGLEFEIQAPTAAGLASINKTVPNNAGYYAIVTGSLGTALYVSEFSQPGNSMYAAAGTTYSGSATPRLNSFGHNQYPLSDTDIGLLVDNEIYTIAIYHDNATPTNNTSDDVLLATYTSNAGKRPYLRTELTVASFAAITAPTKVALTAFANAGGTINVTWTLPPGMQPVELHYFRSGSTGFDSTSVNLTSTQTSAPLTVLPLSQAGIGTLQANGINLAIADSFGRELTTIYNGQ